MLNAAHLDVRFGKLDANERFIAELLVSEGHNVTHIPPKKSGIPTPDLVGRPRVVGGGLAEVKTSVGADADRLRQKREGAQADHVFVDARLSRIGASDVSALAQRP